MRIRETAEPSTKKRYICSLAIISLPFACTIPNERESSNAEGGTAGETASVTATKTRGGTVNSATGGTKGKGGSTTASGGIPYQDTTGVISITSSTSQAGTRAEGGSIGSMSTGGVTAVGGSTAESGTGGTTAVASTSGTVAVTHLRDCSTSGDGDQNGTNDQLETQYCACKPYEAQACTDLSKEGPCGVGAKICVVSSDKTTSSWSTCTTPKPVARDCSSTNDNDCQNGPDKSEAACQLCQSTTPQNCGQENNKYASNWGKGLCVAGKRHLNVSSAGCSWGDCTGEVIPTSEACGPDKPDANCDGIAGDGNYAMNCLQRLHICTTTALNESNSTVSTSPCASDQTDLSLSVFVAPRGSATTPLLECRVTDVYSGSYGGSSKTCTYIAFGQCNTTDSDTITKILGYVTTSSVAGYRAIAFPKSNLVCNQSKSINPPPVFASSCTNCIPTKYYAIP
jgi:hypothetical protein